MTKKSESKETATRGPNWLPRLVRLVDVMAQACYYAQQHIDDPEAWDVSSSAREEYLQCVSFQMACFLAQNTKHGNEGVEWETVLQELVAHPMKTEDQWRDILNEKAELFGGWS